jgi:hypothetical protein
MVWKKLRKLVGAGGKAEAERAQAEAEKSLEAAQSRTAEIEQLVGRIRQHGYVNHIGERVMAGIRGV